MVSCVYSLISFSQQKRKTRNEQTSTVKKKQLYILKVILNTLVILDEATQGKSHSLKNGESKSFSDFHLVYKYACLKNDFEDSFRPIK